MTELERKRLWIVKHRKRIERLYPKIRNIQLYLDKKQNRYIISIQTHNKRYITKQYAKIKMEVKLNVILERDDTVDHKDRNKTNDKYSNLQVLDRVVHCSLDVKRRKYDFEAVCPWCSNTFVMNKNQLREQGRKKQKAGPFCSRSCSGKYGANVQNGGKRLKRNEVEAIYYTNKDEVKYKN